MVSTVFEIVLLLAAVLGAIWGAVVLHEAGHYVAGLCLGVPACCMRMRLERPPHVALRSGEDWLSPDDPEYASAFTQHNSSAVAGWLFVAGGFLVETFVILLTSARCGASSACPPQQS